MKKEKEMWKCPKCGSIFTYFRIRTQTHVCHRCGAEWKEKEERGKKVEKKKVQLQ